jgi:hypothetical protein
MSAFCPGCGHEFNIGGKALSQNDVFIKVKLSYEDISKFKTEWDKTSRYDIIIHNEWEEQLLKLRGFVKSIAENDDLHPWIRKDAIDVLRGLERKT